MRYLQPHYGSLKTRSVLKRRKYSFDECRLKELRFIMERRRCVKVIGANISSNADLDGLLFSWSPSALGETGVQSESSQSQSVFRVKRRH